LEAFPYAIVATMEHDGSDPLPNRLYAAGGGARSRVWRQIVSDVLAREQVYLKHADRARGSALLALSALNRTAFDAALENERDMEITTPVQSLEEYKPSLDFYREMVRRERPILPYTVE